MRPVENIDGPLILACLPLALKPRPAHTRELRTTPCIGMVRQETLAHPATLE